MVLVEGSMREGVGPFRPPEQQDPIRGGGRRQRRACPCRQQGDLRCGESCDPRGRLHPPASTDV